MLEQSGVDYDLDIDFVNELINIIREILSEINSYDLIYFKLEIFNENFLNFIKNKEIQNKIKSLRI